MPYQSGETPAIGDHVTNQSGKPGKITAVALNQGHLRGEDSVRIQWDDGSIGIGNALAREFIFVRKPYADEAADFLSYCPECKESKPARVDRDFLKVALEKNEAIKVASICGHSWMLQEHERKNAQKVLA